MRAEWGTAETSGTATEKQVAFIRDLIVETLDPPYRRNRPEPATDEERAFREQVDLSVDRQLAAQQLGLLLQFAATAEDLARFDRVHKAARTWLLGADPAHLSKSSASWFIGIIKNSNAMGCWAAVHTDSPAEAAVLVNEAADYELVIHRPDGPVAREYPLVFVSSERRRLARLAARQEA